MVFSFFALGKRTNAKNRGEVDLTLMRGRFLCFMFVLPLGCGHALSAIRGSNRWHGRCNGCTTHANHDLVSYVLEYVTSSTC